MNKLLKIARAYFPMSKKQKQDYLSRVIAAVDVYKPKIEEKTGINLGDISVKEFKEIESDAFAYVMEHMHDNLGRIPSEAEMRSKLVVGKLARPFAKLFRICNEDFEFLRYYNKTNDIYVPFGFFNKVDIFSQNDSYLDQKVVNGLSHALWWRLRGSYDYNSDNSNSTKWENGFAAYCDDTHFKEVYPNGQGMRRLRGERNNRQKIEQIVQGHGEEILLRVPREWQQFENELGSATVKV